MYKNPEDRNLAPLGEATTTQTRRLYQALLPEEGVPTLDERFYLLQDIRRKQALKGVDAALEVALYFPLSIRYALENQSFPIIAMQKGGNRKFYIVSGEYPDGFRSLGALSEAEGKPLTYTAFAVNKQGELTILVQNLSGNIESAVSKGEHFDLAAVAEGEEFLVGLRDPYQINTISSRIHTFLDALNAFQV